MPQESVEDQLSAQPPQELLVVHSAGESRYPTRHFSIDDKSMVLMVYSDDGDPKRRRLVAAFNREYWIRAVFVDVVDEGVGDG